MTRMRRITFTIPWPITAAETRELLTFAFQVALVTYLSFFLWENIAPGFITMYVSLDTFLWVALCLGMVAAIWPSIVPESKRQSTGKPTWQDLIWMGVLAFGTVVVVWGKMVSVGWLVAVVAPLSGLIVLGLSLLVYYDRDTDQESIE